MSLCVSRVHVAPRASFAPRIRRWTRAPTPSPVPRGIIGRSNGNAVPIIPPLPLRAFAFEAFAFAAQEERADTDPRPDATSTSYVPVDDEARKTRLEQLQNAYTNRAPSMGYMAPKMPDGYRVRVEEPTAGSGKTRIVVTLGADEKTGMGGDAVGWVTCWVKKSNVNRVLSPGAAADGDALFLSSVEVKKSHRRMGIASRLLHEAEALASLAFNCEFATLTVLKNNDAAISLYEGRGYNIDDGSGADAAEKVKSFLMDPQRILQHRMTKRLGKYADTGADRVVEK